MNDPDLYRRSNTLRQDELDFLKEFSSKIQWRSDGKDSVLDIGCAGGDVTAELVRSVLPSTFSRLIGVDVNQTMVEYANKHFGESKVEFHQVDAGGDISEFLKKHGTFDHVTSLLCLQLMPDQRHLMRNIYNLLQPNGDCVLYILVDYFAYDVFHVLYEKWSEYMEGIDQYISAYYHRVSPVNMLRKSLALAGFSHIDVQEREATVTYDNMKSFEDTYKAVTHFYSRIPLEKQQAFTTDFLNTSIRELKKASAYHEAPNNAFRIDVTYKLVTAYARK